MKLPSGNKHLANKSPPDLTPVCWSDPGCSAGGGSWDAIQLDCGAKLQGGPGGRLSLKVGGAFTDIRALNV